MHTSRSLDPTRDPKEESELPSRFGEGAGFDRNGTGGGGEKRWRSVEWVKGEEAVASWGKHPAREGRARGAAPPLGAPEDVTDARRCLGAGAGRGGGASEINRRAAVFVFVSDASEMIKPSRIFFWHPTFQRKAWLCSPVHAQYDFPIDSGALSLLCLCLPV